MLQELRLTVANARGHDLDVASTAFLDALPLLAFIAGPEGATVYANAQYQGYTGYSAETLAGDGWAQLIHPDDRSQIAASWMSALIMEAAFEVEGRLRRSDGVYRWFKTRAVPCRSPNGSIEYWLGIGTDVHDLKVAKLEAHNAEEWLRLAQEASGVGTFEWDPITQELSWSRECKALFGLLPTDEVTDELFMSRVHPEDRGAVLAAIEQAFEPLGSRSYHSRYRALWPDGTLRWVDARGRATFDEVVGLRRAVRFIGTVLDVTDAKRTEENLARQREELQTISDALPALIWVAAPDGAVRHLNDWWYRYTGQAPNEALGEGWAQVLHPDDVQAVTRAWSDALTTGQLYEIQCRYRRSDGLYRRHLARAEPMRDGSGVITAWVGTSSDIEDHLPR